MIKIKSAVITWSVLILTAGLVSADGNIKEGALDNPSPAVMGALGGEAIAAPPISLPDELSDEPLVGPRSLIPSEDGRAFQQGVDQSADSQPKKVAQAVLTAFNEFHAPSEDKSVNDRVQAYLLGRFMDFISRGEPIHFILPAFPAKSPNKTEKVLGDHPDYGEELALQRLSALCEKIRRIYPQGADMVIASDGRVFTGTWWSSDAAVDLYLAELKKIKRDPAISFAALDDFYAQFSHNDMRKELMNRYAPSLEQINKDIETRPGMLKKYLGLKKFNDGDRDPKFQRPLGRKERERENGVRAKDDLRRTAAYSAFLQEKFPRHVRLSVHPQTASIEKAGVHLMPPGNYHGLPWHNVVVLLSDGSHLVMKRQEAEARGFRLVYRNGRPYHYEQ